MKKIGLILFAWVMVAGACAPVGPDYRRVDPPVPSSFGSLEPGISTGEEPQRKISQCPGGRCSRILFWTV